MPFLYFLCARIFSCCFHFYSLADTAAAVLSSSVIRYLGDSCKAANVHKGDKFILS